MDEPRHALPVMRPRCCLRYLTFFGIIMAWALLQAWRRFRAWARARGALPASTGVAAPSAAAGWVHRYAPAAPFQAAAPGRQVRWARVRARRVRAAAADDDRDRLGQDHDRRDRAGPHDHDRAGVRAPTTIRACDSRYPE